MNARQLPLLLRLLYFFFVGLPLGLAAALVGWGLCVSVIFMPFGIWVLHGDLEDGQFELLRPARHLQCSLPFAVWLALAKATPLRNEGESPQQSLGGDLVEPAEPPP